ncbi:MAG: hypothetical protein Q4D29_12195 [Lachnospiraceae bacterium]|nr:hypothetical protein [Lachnospiraceae bacterium]
MKILLYGFDGKKKIAIKRKFGYADYIDVTSQYQDILALCADKVIVSVDNTSAEILKTIKEYQNETEGVDKTEYYYVTDDETEEYFIGFYNTMTNAIDEIADIITKVEFEALHLFGLQRNHNGIITYTLSMEDADIKHYEYFRPEIGKRELLIISLGDNLIDSKTYRSYEERYDIVSVACYKEKLSRRSGTLELYEEGICKENLPPVLHRVKDMLDKAMETFINA